MSTLINSPPPSIQSLRVSFDLDDAEDQRWVHGWQDEGCNADTLACCAVTRIYNRTIDQNRSLGRHIVITSFQKSASTFLTSLLVSATGYRLHLLHATGRDNERNIEIQRVPLFLHRNTVSQEHMRATEPNIAMLQRMGVKPIVLVRNIGDALVSLRDHWVKEEPVSAIAHVPPGFAQWSSEDQLWFCVRVATPWYFNFYTSWLDRGVQVGAIWACYDQVVHDTLATLRRVTRHCGVDITDEALERAMSSIDLKRVRFNQGVAGRGQSELTAEQHSSVRDIARSFGDRYDWAMLGL